MVNFLETLYAITGLALLTMAYYTVRGRKSELARQRFTGASWVFVIGLLLCIALYVYLSPAAPQP